MTNTVLTHQMIAREAADVFMEASPFLKTINRGREEEFGTDRGGYKIGSSVTVKIPPTGVVYDGSNFAGGGSAPAFAEGSVSLTLSNQKHVPLTFTAKEKVLNITDFKERILKPQISTLAAYVEADLIAQATKLTPNLVGTPGVTPNSMKTFSQARQLLQQNLAPADPRTVLMTSEANVELVDTSKVLFNPVKEIANAYTTGVIGNYGGADWFECVNLPSLTVGTDVTGITVHLAGSGGNTLVVNCTNGDTFKAGQVFTINAVNAVHPLTGNSYGIPRQFVITADATASSTTVALSIYPALTNAAPNQTIDALPVDTAAITFASGAASSAHSTSLMYHRDAFTAAFAPLPILASCEGYTFSANGFSIRVMTFGNGQSDTESTRVDVLYGIAAVRGIHACRIIQ